MGRALTSTWWNSLCLDKYRPFWEGHYCTYEDTYLGKQLWTYLSHSLPIDCLLETHLCLTYPLPSQSTLREANLSLSLAPPSPSPPLYNWLSVGSPISLTLSIYLYRTLAYTLTLSLSLSKQSTHRLVVVSFLIFRKEQMSFLLPKIDSPVRKHLSTRGVQVWNSLPQNALSWEHFSLLEKGHMCSEENKYSHCKWRWRSTFFTKNQRLLYMKMSFSRR